MSTHWHITLVFLSVWQHHRALQLVYIYLYIAIARALSSRVSGNVFQEKSATRVKCDVTKNTVKAIQPNWKRFSENAGETNQTVKYFQAMTLSLSLSFSLFYLIVYTTCAAVIEPLYGALVFRLCVEILPVCVCVHLWLLIFGRQG